MPRPRIIILDSTPLSLLCRSTDLAAVDQCHDWYLRHASRQVRFFVPEIVLYEVRRELLRLVLSKDLVALDALVTAETGRLVLLDSPALTLAAELWAQVRRQGRPTADAAALDIDVILSAQVLTAGWDVNDIIVATSNVKHLQLFVPAAAWADI